MPILKNNPVASQPSGALPSLGERAFGIAQTIAEDYSRPYIEIYQNAQYLAGKKPPLISYPSDATPWSDYIPASRYSDIAVWSIPVPAGAVLTHCFAEERTEYSARPLSDFTQASLSIQPQYVVDKKTGKIATVRGSASVTNDSAADKLLKTEEGAALSASLDKLPATSPQGYTAKFQPELDALSRRIGMDRVSQALNKTYIGDFLPRKAELRFVLQDTLEFTGEGQPARLALGRYELLARLRAMFCANPTGAALAAQAAVRDAKSMAAKINAANLAGRLVKVDSMGLKAYGVASWVTVLFRHQEFPDTDQIAVQVILMEFESVYETSFPKIPQEGQEKKKIQVEPVPEPREAMSDFGNA